MLLKRRAAPLSRRLRTSLAISGPKCAINTDRLVDNDDAALGKELLYVAQAESIA